jgi:hypothetical protein
MKTAIVHLELNGKEFSLLAGVEYDQPTKGDYYTAPTVGGYTITGKFTAGNKDVSDMIERLNEFSNGKLYEDFNQQIN